MDPTHLFQRIAIKGVGEEEEHENDVVSLSPNVVTVVTVVSPLNLSGCNEEGILTLLYLPDRVVR